MSSALFVLNFYSPIFIDQLKRGRIFRPIEHPPSAAEDDGEDHQPILIHQIVIQRIIFIIIQVGLDRLRWGGPGATCGERH